MAIVSSSEFWGNNYQFVQDQSNYRKIIARMLNLKQNRKDRALLSTLLGASAGSTATATLKRVAHSVSELGGLRTVETESLVDRATTSDDDTLLTAEYLTYSSRPSSYPVDRATHP